METPKETLTESELADFLKNNAVRKLTIILGPSGKFRIVVNLTWKQGDYYLLTTRKTVREWASLDRLARHINDNYGVPPLIELSLQTSNRRTK